MTQIIVTKKLQTQPQNFIMDLALSRGFHFVEHKTWPSLGLEADIFNYSSLFGTRNRILELAKVIREVHPDAAVHEVNTFTIPPTPKVTPQQNVTLNDTMAATNFPNVWKDSTFDGGTKVIIGSCDTGVDRSANGEFCFEDQPADGHPHTSRILGSADYAGGTPYHPHGTWTTKFASRSPNVDGTWRGACYKARIYSAQVLNSQGQGSTVQVVDGLNYLVSQKCNVINMSLGGPHDDTINQAVEGAWKAGSAICAAEGNSGRYPPACDGSINSPGDADDAIAVGACCIASQGNGQFQVQTWTDRGKRKDGSPVPYCITAPGVTIQPGPTDAPNSGTSFATPHLTGAFAVCVDKALQLGLSGVDMNVKVRNALMTTAKKLGYENNFPADQAYCIQGNGLLQADLARQAIAGTPPPPPPPPSSDVAQHTYNSTGSYNAKVTVTDANGIVQTGTVTIIVQAPPPPPSNPLDVMLTADKTSGEVPLTVNFTANVTGGITPYTYSWVFGD